MRRKALGIIYLFDFFFSVQSRDLKIRTNQFPLIPALTEKRISGLKDNLVYIRRLCLKQTKLNKGTAPVFEESTSTKLYYI